MFSWFSVSRFFLIISVLSVAIVTPSTLFPFIVGKYVMFRACVSLALLAFLIGTLFQHEAHAYLVRFWRIFRLPLVIAVTVWVLIYAFAGFFGANPHFSFWSNFERGEGTIQILHLYVFFLLLVTLFDREEDWKRIFFYSIVGGLLMILYGVFGSSGVEGFIGPPWSETVFRFHGSIGNPAYVSAYLIFVAAYAVYLLIDKGRKGLLSPLSGIPLLVTLLIFGAFFILAATRGAFVGLAAAVLVGLAYLAFSVKKWRKWLLGAGAVFILLISLGVYFKDAPFMQNVPGHRIFDLSFSADTFQKRAVMWKIAVNGAIDRPLLGWGAENFPLVYDKHYEVSDFTPGVDFGAWFDRAHSVIFDHLVESGFLGLVSFLVVFLLYYIEFFRHRRGERGGLLKEALVLALPVAYFVQGLALFDVLVIYYNIFLLLAFGQYSFLKWQGLTTKK